MMKKEKWIVAPKDEDRIRLLQQDLGISHLAASVLAARGIGSAGEAQAFMDSDWHHLHDPYLIADMDKAVEILEDAIQKGERIATPVEANPSAEHREASVGSCSTRSAPQRTAASARFILSTTAGAPRCT